MYTHGRYWLGYSYYQSRALSGKRLCIFISPLGASRMQCRQQRPWWLLHCAQPTPPPLQVYSHKIWLWIQSYGLLLRGCDCWSTIVTSCWQTYAHEIRTLWQTSTAMNIGVSLICCLHGDTCVVAMHYATPLFWRWAGHQQSARALNCRGRLSVL